ITALTEDIMMQVGTQHSEILRFDVIHLPNHPLILGLPWLRKHDPHISWSKGEIQQWSSQSHNLCIPSESTIPVNTITYAESSVEVPGLPAEYHALAIAFSKHKASLLPPHRPSDCAIELIPGSTPPKGRIFPLSQPKSEAMKKYVEEELAKGFIRPSTSPATAGFFFVKKDGTLSTVLLPNETLNSSRGHRRPSRPLQTLSHGSQWPLFFITQILRSLS
ncbi:hypothetical protein M9458_013562, partial [Cirrhinus mrigala]